MSLVRKIFPELRQMMRQMEDSLLPPLQRFRFGENPVAAFMPVADISESDKLYTIETELPGVSKDDIKLELPDAHTLIIRAEVKEPELQSRGKKSGERYFGMMERSFVIPSGIKEEEIEAELKDGLLKLQIPKGAEAKKPLQIKWK